MEIPEPIARVEISEDGSVIVGGKNLARDREIVEAGLRKALEWLESHEEGGRWK